MAAKSLRPRGAILAASLICLLVVLLFSGAVVRGIVMRQHSARWEERQLQCFWLAESAVARAVAQSSADPEYAGETWKITLPGTGGGEVGVAEIIVDRASVRPQAKELRRITVQARWPDAPIERIVQTRELMIMFPLPIPEQGKRQ